MPSSARGASTSCRLASCVTNGSPALASAGVPTFYTQASNTAGENSEVEPSDEERAQAESPPMDFKRMIDFVGFRFPEAKGA